MRRIQKLVLFFLAGALFLTLLFYTLLPLIIKKDLVKEVLVESVEKLTGGSLKVQRIQVQYFPALIAIAEDISLSSNGTDRGFLSARKAYFHLNAFRYLLGHMSITSLLITDGSARCSLPENFPVRELELSRLKLSLSPLKAKEPVRVAMEADLVNVERAVQMNGTVQADQLDHWDWDNLALHLELDLNQFELAKISQAAQPHSKISVKDGNLSGKLAVDKKQGDATAEARGNLELLEWVYQVTDGTEVLVSPAMDGTLEIEFSWQPRNNEVHLKSSVLNSPLGKIEANGTIILDTGEIKGMRLTATDLMMENIPQYFITFRDAIPYGFGFSGPSDFDLSVEGPLDHLSLHANWDFTKTLLSYSRFFSKPKGTALNLAFDFLLRDAHLLSGDFSLRLQETTFKGNFSDVDFRTGIGQLNILTNKFPLKGWEALIPPLAGYTLNGEAKVLYNINGHLLLPSRGQSIVNLTLENGDFTRQDGFGIHQAELALDYSPSTVEIKKARFNINEFPHWIELVMHNLQDKPTLKAIVSSSKFRPVLFLKTLEDFLQPLLPEDWGKGLAVIGSQARKILSAETTLDNFSSEITLDENRRLLFKGLQFEAYEGKASSQISVDFSKEPQDYKADFEIDRLSLAKYLEQNDPFKDLVNGNLFLKLKLRGSASDPENAWTGWSGEGEAALTNGEFKSFDLLGAISEIGGMNLLKSRASGKTAFDDIRSSFILKDGKISSNNLELVSRELQTTGGGDIGSDGGLNFRLNVFLTTPVSEAFLQSVYGESLRVAPGEQFGPIVMLLTGKLGQASVKPDPSSLPELKDQILKKKTQRNFRNFLPEESFFGGRTNR